MGMGSHSERPRRRSATLHRLQVAVVAVIGLVVTVLAISGAADRTGVSLVDEALGRALVTFGVSRTLNGVISVAQGTEFAFQPAGMGVNLAPGQILDPVNDLVERFSWIMLASSTALGVQRVLLDILAWPGFTLLLAVMAMLLVTTLALSSGWLASRRRLILRIALAVLLLRFLVPGLAFFSEGVHRVFLEPRYEQALAGLEEASLVLGEANAEAVPDGAGEAEMTVLERLRRLYDDAESSLDLDGRFTLFKRMAGEITGHALDLIVVFLFQALLLPLVFLYGARALYRLTVSLLRPTPA